MPDAEVIELNGARKRMAQAAATAEPEYAARKRTGFFGRLRQAIYGAVRNAVVVVACTPALAGWFLLRALPWQAALIAACWAVWHNDVLIHDNAGTIGTALYHLGFTLAAGLYMSIAMGRGDGHTLAAMWVPVAYFGFGFWEGWETIYLIAYAIGLRFHWYFEKDTIPRNADGSIWYVGTAPSPLAQRLGMDDGPDYDPFPPGGGPKGGSPIAAPREDPMGKMARDFWALEYGRRGRSS